MLQKHFDYRNGFFHFITNVTNLLSDEIVYVRIKKIAFPDSGWSPLSLDWKVSSQCQYVQQYLNTSLELRKWSCDTCPVGASCTGRNITWREVKPLFGWWRNQVWTAMRPSNLQNASFHQPFRRSNSEHRGRFITEEGVDMSMIDSPESCNPNAGYEVNCDRDPFNRCRLCATCKEGYRRRDIGSA